MEAKASWIKDREFLIEANGCEFIAEGGHGEKAPSPAHYFAAGLASGVADWIEAILRADGADTTGLSVLVRSHGADSKHFGGAYEITVTLPEGLSDPLQKTARKAAESCLEAHSLIRPTSVKFEYHILESKEDALWNPTI